MATGDRVVHLRISLCLELMCLRSTIQGEDTAGIIASSAGETTTRMDGLTTARPPRLAMLKEVAPFTVRVAFVANPKFRGYDYFWRFAQAAAPALALLRDSLRTHVLRV
jgi:hypothetical protein